MKLNIVFIVSAIYFGLVGIGHLISPVAMSLGVVPADASSGLVAFLRHYSAIFIGIAVMNFMVRNAEPSPALTAIVLANIVMFGLASVLDVAAVVSGAGFAGLVPATINMAIAVSFISASRAAMLAKTSVEGGQ